MEVQRLSISRSALEHNLQFFRRLVPQSLFLAVVKSNAYGHGLHEVVEILKGKVDWFGVNSLEEALAVHGLDPKTPILVMGLNGLECTALLDAEYVSSFSPSLRRQLHFVLSSLDSIRQVSELGLHNLSFHLKIDTGLSRLGVSLQEAPQVLEFLKKGKYFEKKEKPEGPSCGGMITHFANVEDVSDQGYALKQLGSFTQICQQARALASKPLLCHAAASAAAMVLPASRLDMIRIGISLYGLWASSQTRLSFLSQNSGHDLPQLIPALRWSSRIIHINAVKRGSFVGYGCTYRTEQDTTVGVVPVGYYEGYERALSDRAYVLVRGRRARLLGRVSMNMICVDLSLIEGVRVGDEVTLIGKDGGDAISADQLADMTSTIHYEVVTRINMNIPRVIVD